MKQEIQKYVSGYLNGELDRESFTKQCKRAYGVIVKNPELMIHLDHILIAPFLHEFAYSYDDANEDFQSKVSFFLSLLNGQQNYRYSAFCRLMASKSANDVQVEQFLSRKEVDLLEVSTFFSEPIEEPKTVKDLLHNSIFEMLSKCNLENTGEDFYIDNYINCNYHDKKEIDPSSVRKRIRLLLSYYLGREELFIQITLVSNGNTLYTIV